MTRDLAAVLFADSSADGGLEELLGVDVAPCRWMERTRVFRRNGKAVAALAQPYTLSTEDLAEILDLCERHRLRVDISMHSEWNPGETLGVLFWCSNLNPFIPPHLAQPS